MAGTCPNCGKYYKRLMTHLTMSTKCRNTKCPDCGKGRLAQHMTGCDLGAEKPPSLIYINNIDNNNNNTTLFSLDNDDNVSELSFHDESHETGKRKINDDQEFRRTRIKTHY